MSPRSIVLLGIRTGARAELGDRLGLREQISTLGDFEVWRSDLDSAALLAELPPLLRARRVQSAAFLDFLPASDKRWVAVEWAQKVVVSLALEPVLSIALQGWERQVFAAMHLAIYTPPKPEARAEFRGALASGEPLSVPYQVPESLAAAASDESWFGELAVPGNGGVVALLTISGARGSGRIGLRSPAALNLEVSEDLRGTARLVRAGALRIHAVGLSRADPVPASFVERCAADTPGAEGLRERFEAALRDVDGRAESYRLLLHVHAPLADPALVIPAGAVFEQSGFNGVQTLAAASAVGATVDAGAFVPLALPAWCLNKNLAPPSGQPVLPTVLRYKGQGTQEQVWKDLADRFLASQP